MNALEKFLEDKDSARVTFNDLRAFAEEHRELEQRFKERGDRLFESGKMIVIREERCKELEAQLAQREGECCLNCFHGIKHEKSLILVTCRREGCTQSLAFTPKFKCRYYAAKPKVKRCKWEISETTDNRFTEDEAKEKWGHRLIGPVEGTWEDVNEST